MPGKFFSGQRPLAKRPVQPMRKGQPVGGCGKGLPGADSPGRVCRQSSYGAVFIKVRKRGDRGGWNAARSIGPVTERIAGRSGHSLYRKRTPAGIGRMLSGWFVRANKTGII